MVNLGLVRRVDIIELGIPLVFFAYSETAHEPVLRSWPYNGSQLWELEITVTPEEKWPQELAGCLRKMRWSKWALDIASTMESSDLGPENALVQWGDKFWPGYREDAIVYLLLEEKKDLGSKMARIWDRNHTHVCFRPRYDLTERPVDREEPTPQGRLSRLKKKIRRCK